MVNIQSTVNSWAHLQSQRTAPRRSRSDAWKTLTGLLDLKCVCHFKQWKRRSAPELLAELFGRKTDERKQICWCVFCQAECRSSVTLIHNTSFYFKCDLSQFVLKIFVKATLLPLLKHTWWSFRHKEIWSLLISLTIRLPTVSLKQFFTKPEKNKWIETFKNKLILKINWLVNL